MLQKYVVQHKKFVPLHCVFHGIRFKVKKVTRRDDE
jgi:hypothetical protein